MSRAIWIVGAVAFVPLTRGFEATMDADDVPLLEGRDWCALVSPKRRAVYAARVTQSGGKQAMLLLHRVILNPAPGLLVDHIDGNGLNNCRTNLRVCTKAENSRNVPRRSDNTSGFKGAVLDKRVNRWRAEITIGKQPRSLGYHDTPEEADQAYAAAARLAFGQFARTE